MEAPEAHPTFFDQGKRAFKDVPLPNGEIATSEFLEACESVVAIFDLLNSAAFTPVKSDMAGNIKKIKDRYLSHPTSSGTLQSLVKNELAEKKNTASEGLLWLNRGLSFTAKALRKNVQNQEAALGASFTEAYGETLKKFHGMVIRGVFSVAMRACPDRAGFELKLRNGHDDQPTKDKLDGQLEEWVTSLELCVDILNKWIEKVDLKV